MKKLFTLLFAIAASLGTTFAGEERGTCGDNLTWVITNDYYLTIGGTGAMYDYSNQGPWSTRITEALIGNGVTTIGNCAFRQCRSLTSVTIGNSVTSIGRSSFWACTSLTSINIPNSITSFGERAFSGCSSLTSITIPESVTSIEDETFESCTSLTSITIPNSVTSIGRYAFKDCDDLTSVKIGNSVTSIGEYAFYDCDLLNTLSIGKSVTSIGKNAFTGCYALTSVTCYATTPPAIQSGCFTFPQWRNVPLYVPAGSVEAYQKADVWKDFAFIIPIVAKYVCDFTKKSSKHTNYYDAWTYDDDWTVYGGANNDAKWDYVKMGGKSATLANANPVYVVNKSAFDSEIASVKVTFPAGSFSKSGMSCNNWGVKVYSDLACTRLLYTVHGGTISKNAETLTINAVSGQPWSAGYAIQVYWDLANSSTSNGIVHVSRIEYSSEKSTNYTIRFLNYDGSELQVLSDVAEGTLPVYTGATPTRPSDSQYTYTFKGWSPQIVEATADATYTAQFTATAKPTDENADCEDVDSIWLQTGGSDLGEITSNNPEVWTYSTQYGAYGKKQGGATGWLLTPSKNLLDMKSITLSFNHTHKYATVPEDELTLWVCADYQGSVESSSWQQLTISPYAANTNWTFVKVSIDVPLNMVGANTVFGFKYVSTSSSYATWEIKDLHLEAECKNVAPDTYTITFLNYDGSELQVLTEVKEGTMPEYTGETPTRPDDEQYTYIFTGWTPEIVAVTANATYTATFEARDKYEGIEDVQSDKTQCAKEIRDGQILILRGDHTYTLTGQEVK